MALSIVFTTLANSHNYNALDLEDVHCQNCSGASGTYFGAGAVNVAITFNGWGWAQNVVSGMMHKQNTNGALHNRISLIRASCVNCTNLGRNPHQIDDGVNAVGFVLYMGSAQSTAYLYNSISLKDVYCHRCTVLNKYNAMAMMARGSGAVGIAISYIGFNGGTAAGNSVQILGAECEV